MMAAVAIGVYPDMTACTDAWVAPFLDKVTVPDPQLSAYYAKLYPIYRTIRMPPCHPLGVIWAS